MKLRLIEGGAGSGKSYLCLQELAARQQAEPVGKPLLLLVPEQATFAGERAYVNFVAEAGVGERVGASLRVQAVSFSGLYRLLAAEQKFAALPWLDEQGRAMLLEACLQQHRGRLEVLDAAAGNISFVDALARALVEFEQYAVAPADLRRAAEQLTDRLLAAKLRDLALLFEAYLHMVVGGFRDQGLMMAELAQAAAVSEMLEGAEIWLDNFLDFNPSQLAVVRALFPKVQAVNLCLCLPPEAAENRGIGRIFGGQRYLRRQFLQLAAELGAEVEITRLTANQRQRHNQELAAVEACFAFGCFGHRLPRSADWADLPLDCPPEHIELAAMPDLAAEAAYAAQTISRLCRDEGYKFREIAVITRNLANYRTELENAFRDFNIPYFFDMGADLGRHPLVKLIGTVLSVLAENWSTPAVLAYLKSGLAPLSLDEADILENYALRCGLKSYMWRQAGQFKRAGGLNAEQLAQINALAERALRPLLNFWEQTRTEQNRLPVGALAGALQALLNDLRVAETLLSWEQQAMQRQELRLADAHRQILPKVEQLLAQLQAFLADLPVSFAEFAELWQEGTARLQLSSIPPSANEVNVAEVSRSRLPEIRVAIVLGLNDGELPAALAEDGLLGSLEREQLAGLPEPLELAAGPRERQENEEYLAYIALTRSSERLYLSYAEQAADGTALRPSIVVTQMRQIFPGLAVRRPEDLPLVNTLGGERHLLAGLAAHLTRLREGEPVLPAVDDFWRGVCRQLTASGRLLPQLNALRQGLAYQVDRAPLDKRRYFALYGRSGTTSTSVSRLERFNSCPCKYYASYGLGLAPRPEFKLQTADIGTLYHYILSEVMQQLVQEHCVWADLTAERLEPLVRRTLEQFAERGLAEILADSGKNSYMAEKIVAVVTQSLLDMAANLAAGSFQPRRFELSFGERNGLQPLRLELSDGRLVELRGVIDRVDVAAGSEAAFVRIIDYKMQNKTLSLSDIYYGLNWQLPLYLEALLQTSRQKLRPAGMFYVPIQEIIKNVQSLAEEGASVKLQGLAILDTEALLLAERDLEPGRYAKTMNVYWKRDSSFGRSTMMGLLPAEYNFMQHCLRRQAAASVERLQAGEIRQRPLEQNGRLICEYCDYYSVCALDLAAERQSRNVDKISKPEVMRRWQNEFGTDEYASDEFASDEFASGEFNFDKE